MGRDEEVTVGGDDRLIWIRRLAYLITVGFLLNMAFLFFQWQALQPWGSRVLLHFSIFLMFPLVFALCLLPIWIGALFFRRTRRLGMLFIVVITVLLSFAILSARGFERYRLAQFERLAQRADPLVAAVHYYERDHDRPPPSLAALVPDYLEEVPDTGIGAYPAFDYLRGDVARVPGDNQWAIFVDVPKGFSNFDQFVYYPSQTYPGRNEWGYFEPVGDWAYVHE